MNKEKLKQRISLLISYDVSKTLNENKIDINIIDESESLDEGGISKISKIAGEDVGNLAKALEKGLGVAVRDIEIIAKDGKSVKATSSADVMLAVKEGRITAQSMSEVYVGLLRSSETPGHVIDSIIMDSKFNTKFQETYGSLFTDTDKLRATLRQKYPPETVEKMITKSRGGSITSGAAGDAKVVANDAKASGDIIKQEGKINIVAKDGSNVTVNVNTNVTPIEAAAKIETAAADGAKSGDSVFTQAATENAKKVKRIKPKAWDKFKRTFGKLNKRWLLKWGFIAAATVGGGYLLFKSIFGGNTTPEDMKGMDDCLADICDDDNVTVETLNGNPVVMMSKTGNSDYDAHQGLKFFTTHVVYYGDNSRNGKWACKGSEVVTTVKEENMLNEQGDATTATDVNTMINLLDFPVSGSDLVEAGKLLQKYVTNGKGKEFLSLYQQSGVGGGDLNKTLKYVYTSDPSSVQAKNNLKALVNQISTGTEVKKEGDGNKNTGIGNIEITWGDAATTTPPIKTEPKKSIYHECTVYPFIVSCKSPKIKEIQTCLGLEEKYQTGNFGPITKKKLEETGYDIISGITEDIYNKIKANCGNVDNSNTTPRQKLPMADIQKVDSSKLKTQIAPTTIIDKLPASLEAIKPADQGERGKQLYDYFNENYNNGDNPENPYIFLQGNRLKYKGEGLDQENLDSLNKYVATLGYTFMKQKEKDDYGFKYVWTKNA
jgi:hypothetical protein